MILINDADEAALRALLSHAAPNLDLSHETGRRLMRLAARLQEQAYVREGLQKAAEMRA